MDHNSKIPHYSIFSQSHSCGRGAPTGTIGFMMDYDTTGVEPDLALLKYKNLVGGGVIKIVDNTVPQR